MDLKIQPTPEVEIKNADKGIITRKEYFRKKEFEEIKEYFFAGHLIRRWRPKAELIYPPVSDETVVHYECDFNREVQNCFIEDNAEEVYLRTPPPCFVVIGKFGSNVTKLSENIAREYGSVLIQVDEVVKEVIKTDTQTGRFLVKVLRLGVALTLNFVLALLSYVAHSAKARHRGYVLCGLPVSPYLYDLPVEQQINYIFSWDNKPTVFINVLYEDEDLVRTRGNTKWKIGRVGNKFSLCPQDGTEEEEEEEEEEEGGEGDGEAETDRGEPDVEVSPSRPKIRLPRDEESQVWSELEVFDLKIKAAIDMIKSRLDPQYFITVDSRVKNEFEIVRARLKLLQVWKVPVPVPLCPKRPKRPSEKKLDFVDWEEEREHEDKLSEVDLEILEVMDLPPQKAIPTLFSKKTISPKYRWELSHYNYVCPVSLREGEVVEGKSEFAVVFMKYIYFFRDEESMTKFLENPRPYALPIRPKPRFRFIIIGYPKCGKTSLANYLSAEFSIPIVDVNTILKNDIVRKKFVYREFCRQKAESREITKLTAQAWERWRKEEEQRISLIEQWISYIQSLLNQRIEQFYSADTADVTSDRETQVHSYLPICAGENSGRETEGSNGSGCDMEKILEVRGVSVETERDPYERERTPVQSHTSPSEKIIRAMKHDDYEFNENGLEVEANLFFSSLWNNFTKDQGRFDPEKALKREIANEERRGEEEEEEGEEESVTVNWCSLLPPQSLSSFLLKNKSYTTREKRKSFRLFLEAAAKVYWCPSTLKTEFAKWRLPCFMDIPLCEIFLDNPLLLFKYCPNWLKERPLIPDPVDPFDPVVTEAGRRAFAKANVVSIHHDSEEKGKLLGHAIEKVERDGMRVTGGVLTPGGWVVDSIDLDPCIWQALVKENVLPDYVYILTDSDPEFNRIISDWWDLLLHLESPVEISSEKSNSATELAGEIEKISDVEETQNLHSALSEMVSKKKSIEGRTMSTMVQTLRKITENINQGNRDLDDIYSVLNNTLQPIDFNVSPLSLDLFSSSVLKETTNYMLESTTDEQPGGKVSNFNFNVDFNFIASRDFETSDVDLPLGDELQFFSQKIFDYFREKQQAKGEPMREELSLENRRNFLVYLLSLPFKIQRVREFLTSLNKEDIIREVDVTNKTLSEILEEVKKDIDAPFLKKPRELENFEKKELLADLRREAGETTKNEEGEEEEEEGEEDEPREDLRIYGESGPFCIVNLYNNNLLLGKPEFALRYYGKLYLFWNQEAKDKFIENPEKYAPYYSPIRCLPPIRIFVTGPIGSGKTTLARAIASQCSTYYVDYITFLNFKLTPHLKPSTKFTALDSQKLLLSEGFNEEAKNIKAKFMRIPYEKRMFYLENPFNAEDEKQSLEDTVSRTPLPSSYPEFVYKSIESIEEDENEAKSQSKIILDESGEPYRSMKEVENTLSDYLQNKSDLGEYGMARSLWYLWSTSPFNTEGVILDGFPMRYFDVKHIIKNTWIPDMVVEVVLPEEIALERNMEQKLEQWDTKLKQEIVEERLLEDTLSALQKVFMSIRRDRLMYGKQHSSFQRMSRQRSSVMRTDDYGGSRDFGRLRARRSDMKKLSSRMITESASKGEGLLNAEQIDQALAREFPPLEFNPIFETYEAGKERLTADFLLNYRRDMQELLKFKTELQNLKIPWYEVDGTKNSAKNLVNLFIRMNEIKQRGNLRGEFAFPMEIETANKLLEQGYYFLSKFGTWCPVQIYRSKNPIQMFRPLKERRKIFPVAYRNYLYFIGGENEKKNFIKNPLKYTFNEPHLPNVPLRIAVIGPPKSGKSTLSSRLGFMFGLKVVTMGTALRFVVENMRGSTLRKSIIGYLKRGCFLPLSLKMEALMASLNDPACVTQGFVLDGIPFDAAMTQSLAEEGKLPFVILSLTADSYFAKSNREKLDREKYRLPYKQRVDMDSSYKDWDETYKRFVQWNQDTYSNLYELNAKSKAVNVFYQAYDIIRKSFFAILYYVEYCVTDRALPLEYLCVSQHEYELRKSSFHNNCPVCWAELSRLNCLSDPPPRSGLVQYLNHFYWICPRHKDSFLKTPKKYLPPNVKEFPQILPKVLERCMFETAPVRIHGLGRCPVTSTDLPNSLEWKGSWDFAVSYAEKVYLCRDEEMMKRFLAQPWKYYMADTEFEASRSFKSSAVEELGPPKLASLPPMGFLEQTVANLLHDALQVLSSARPVYPNLTPTCTGCTFLGLYLKVYNKNKRGVLEREYLNFMMTNCKAYQFNAMPFKRSTEDENDFEPQPSDSNETSTSQNPPNNTSESSVDSFWLDFETQADKMIWSAKNLSAKCFKMKLDEYDQLKEIPEHPKLNVVLRYQSSILRVHPLPPIPNCITVIYSCKPSIQLPEKFNVNTLYQPHNFASRFAQLVASKAEKTQLTKLYERELKAHQSETNLWQGKRAVSESSPSEEEARSSEDQNPKLTFMLENFIPRFQFLDVLPPVQVPGVPKVVEVEPLFFNPHRDYTFTMLMAEFFRISHILKCFEMNQNTCHWEYATLLDRNLGLCTARSQFLFRPKISLSVHSRRSIDSAQEIIEASPWLYYRDYADPYKGTGQAFGSGKPSLANFIQIIIYDHLEDVFSRISSISLSYDSYETQIGAMESDGSLKPVILMQEVLPFPPLSWDIVSRPYYAYRSVRSIFETPQLDHIAHERHVSLLDGIIEPNDHLRFVSYPTWITEKLLTDESIASKSKNDVPPRACSPNRKHQHPVYDFFNLGWTSFLTCYISWAYSLDNRDRFRSEDPAEGTPTNGKEPGEFAQH